MMSNKRRLQRRRNKIILQRLAAIGLILCCYVPVWLENDYTALLIFSFFAVGMWFSDPGL